MNSVRTALLVAGFCVLALAALAGTPADSIHAMVARTWRAEDGLPQNSVTAIAQTPDGFLWFGTEEGLARFDGTTFTVFDGLNTPLLRHAYITALLADDGSLYVGTTEGVAEIRGTKFTKMLDGVHVWSLAPASGGGLWIASETGLLRRNSEGKMSHYGVPEGLPHSAVNTLAEDDAGTLWIGTNRGIARLCDGRITAVRDFPRAEVTRIRPARGGGVWATTKTAGIWRLGKDGTVPWERHMFGKVAVYDVLEQGDGTIWIGTNGEGLLRWQKGRVENVTTRSKLPSKLAWPLFEDTEGSVWVGSRATGVSRLAGAPFMMIGSLDGLPSEVILAVHETPAGEVWVGTGGDGCARLWQGQWVTYNRKSGLPHDLVLTIHGDQRGDVWIGTPGGLSRFRDGRFRLFTTADGLTSNVVSAVLPSRDGALWIGTSGGGLHRLVGQRILPVVLDRDSVGAAILSLLEEPDGTIWIGTDGRGLYRLSGQQWTRFGRNSGLSSEIVLSLHRDAAGTIWIGTAGGGLVRYKAGRMRAITRQQGLFDDTVFQVLEDRTGNFWMGSNRGIFRVPVSELESVADGRLGRVSGTSFGTSHGLASIEVNGGIFPPGWRRRDGTLWFPTVAGIAVTDGEVRERHQMPSVVLDSLNVDGKKMEPESQPLVLPPGSSRLQLRFTMPTFVMPASRQFRYRLEGWDSRWVYAENLGRADYNHLAPGRYTFYVSARLGEGPWSPAKPLLSFSIRPYFYQTLWFRMGVILIALAAGLALHHAATRALRRRQDQLLGLIEKRERAERSLRESEEHFRALIESTSDLTLIADEEGAIYYVSPASKTILGLESNEVMKWRLAELIPADQLKLLLARLETEETALTTVTFDKSRSIQRQLEIVTHRLNCEPQKGRFLVNCRDVSERNLLEKRLQQSDRVAGLGRIAASVAHEFNNVLMGIQPFAEALKRTEKSERVQSLSGNIIDSVRRGKKVTQEILRFVRGAEPVLQPVQVAPWSRRLETELISLVGKSVEVSVTAADNLVMKADPEQITQVMINLALNARDAMPDGGVLEVHFRQASDLDRRRFTLPDTQWIRASVSDTGSGIPPDILPHIFEPLFTTKKHSGNGLGLALVHQVMERHQGQVFVESRPGCTTFILFLPMTSVNENPSTEPSAEVRVSSRSILLIEDDLLVAEGIRLLLSEHGWGVALATAGEEGLAMLDTVDPDVVILDLGLSDMDGLTVFARLMDRRPEIPVVFSTGHGDQAELEQLRSTAHVDFLLKPYDAKALIEKIEAVIASSLNSRLRIPLASA